MGTAYACTYLYHFTSERRAWDSRLSIDLRCFDWPAVSCSCSLLQGIIKFRSTDKVTYICSQPITSVRFFCLVCAIFLCSPIFLGCFCLLLLFFFFFWLWLFCLILSFCFHGMVSVIFNYSLILNSSFLFVIVFPLFFSTLVLFCLAVFDLLLFLFICYLN